MSIPTFYRKGGQFVQVPGFVRLSGGFVPLSPLSLPSTPEMRGDPSFSITSIDNTALDHYGFTARRWYQRTIASMNLRNTDSEFNRNDNRPWNRTGNQRVTLALALFRMTGDLFLLDDSVRLMELAWNRMSVSGGRRYWAGYDQILDTVLSAGLVSAIMWACHNNRDLTSPMGHNYGAIADKYRNWLATDFLPYWCHPGTLQLRKYQQHTFVNGTRIMHYMGRIGGGGAWSAAQFFAERDSRMSFKLARDVTGPVGHGGRTCLVYNHLCDDSTTNTGGVLQYTTYIGGEISGYMDLMLEGFDPRLNATYFSWWANSFADLVCDDKGSGGGTGDRFARTIGGDLESTPPKNCSVDPNPTPGVELLGLRYNHCYRTRPPNHRLVLNAYNLLSAYDSRNRMGPYIYQFYPYQGTHEAPSLPGFAASQALNMIRGVQPESAEPAEPYLSDPFYNPVVAFRGAQGYGANATGGRGNGTAGSTQLALVTNLNDSGTGSLRAALTMTGKRVIVPRVSGYVRLASRIEPTGDFTFLGQLAPGGFGIRPNTLPKDISGYLRIVGVSNVIVRYLTVRSGENTIGYTSNDCIRVSSGASNVILDHVSASYATDEVAQLGTNADLVTLQNCLLAYPLELPGQPEPAHAYATLVYGTGRTSFVRSLIANVRERVPEVYATQKLQWVGNVVYNFRAGAVITVQSDNVLSYVDFQRNSYLPGPWTSTDKDVRFRNRSGIYNRRAQVFLEGNASRFAPDPTNLAGQKEMARVLSASPTTSPTDPQVVSEWVPSVSVDTPALPMLTAAEFRNLVLAGAGNSRYRDAIDARAVLEAQTGSGPSAAFTSASAAGGYPALPSGALPAMSDGVIGTAWRAANGESRLWYELDTGGTGRMIIENYADDIADGVWVEP